MIEVKRKKMFLVLILFLLTFCFAFVFKKNTFAQWECTPGQKDICTGTLCCTNPNGCENNPFACGPSNLGYNECVTGIEQRCCDETGHWTYCCCIGCFPGETKIGVRESEDLEYKNRLEKEIKELRPGDYVSSFDSETGEILRGEVSEVQKYTREGYYLLETESGGKVKATGEHPFLAIKSENNQISNSKYQIISKFKKTISDLIAVFQTNQTQGAQDVLELGLKNASFIPIKNLQVGDWVFVKGEDDELVSEQIIKLEYRQEEVEVFNLSVDDEQTFFANNFAVHNKTGEHETVCDLAVAPRMSTAPSETWMAAKEDLRKRMVEMFAFLVRRIVVNSLPKKKACRMMGSMESVAAVVVPPPVAIMIVIESAGMHPILIGAMTDVRIGVRGVVVRVGTS